MDTFDVESAERTVEVVVRLRTPVRMEVPDGRPIRVTQVKLVYAGRGYVRVEVRGGGRESYWSHVQGRPSDAGNLRDTCHAPEALRKLAAEHAPPDFTGV